MAFLPNSVDVRKVLGKSYAFVEFDSFPSADFVCKQSVHTPYVLGGKNLTIGWGKTLDEVEALAGEEDTNRQIETEREHKREGGRERERVRIRREERKIETERE